MQAVHVDNRRIRTLRESLPKDGPFVYLMARDQRLLDNWALLYAQQQAIAAKQSLIVLALPVLEYPGISPRQLTFSLAGLEQLETNSRKLNIPFHRLITKKSAELTALLSSLKAGTVVTDFSPLRQSRQWKESLAKKIEVPFYEVDAHNIVPARVASVKQEYAAYTFRPKIHRLLPEFLTEFPRLEKHPYSMKDSSRVLLEKIPPRPVPPRDKPESTVFEPGERAAQTMLKEFIGKRLPEYYDKRNDPSLAVQSDLSPYLHFGQIAPQRVALEAQLHSSDIKSQEAFLEELIVRRELADNFCFYNDSYDSFSGFPEWARLSLNQHRSDPRPNLYSRTQLEEAHTHDELWNAAQGEMVTRGKMHGYMRMYWAKKILEWSRAPEEALDTAIFLNNKYELDGYDANGYTGIAWSVGGVHDRPWFEREIFGKIRYMSHSGAKRKFDIGTYINRHKTGAAG